MRIIYDVFLEPFALMQSRIKSIILILLFNWNATEKVEQPLESIGSQENEENKATCLGVSFFSFVFNFIKKRLRYRWFSGVFKVYKMGRLARNGLILDLMQFRS